MTDFSKYEINERLIAKKESTPICEEDPLSPIQQSTEIYDNDNKDFDFTTSSNILFLQDSTLQRDTIDKTDDADLSDTSSSSSSSSSLSFELYQDELVRDKFISQIKQESANGMKIDSHSEISEFMLKYYKYRELNDMSNELGKLIGGIDNDLIELVNDNYLSFINLGKSLDGSLDLIHDVKIDLSDYLKNLRLSNDSIDKDLNNMDKINLSRDRLIVLKVIVKNLIKLNEMIESFDKLCSKFDKNEESTDMLKELVGLYFGINRMFYKLIKQVKDANLDMLINTGILLNLNKKMNGLKLEFKSLLGLYLTHLRESNTTNDEIFEMFKLYQILNCTDDFKKSL